MKVPIYIFLCLMVLSVSLQSQTELARTETKSSAEAIGSSRIENRFSLLDLSRLEMSHSYSISYFSMGGRGMTIGMYVNSIRYQISNPLTLNLSLAWVHQPGNFLLRDRGTATDYGRILPSFSLEYRPSDNFFLEIGYHSIPAYLYPGTGAGFPGEFRPRDWRQEE